MFPDMICPCYLQDIYKDMYTSVTYRELFMFRTCFVLAIYRTTFPRFSSIQISLTDLSLTNK